MEGEAKVSWRKTARAGAFWTLVTGHRHWPPKAQNLVGLVRSNAVLVVVLMRLAECGCGRCWYWYEQSQWPRFGN